MAESWRRALSAIVALVAIACSPSARSGSANGTTAAAGADGGGGVATGGDQSGGTAPAPEPCKTVVVRLIGAGASSVSSLRLVLGGVSVTSGGSPVGVEGSPVGTTLDLSTDAATPPVGKFALPASADPLAVTVSFSGGSSMRDAVAADLDLCTGPLSFTFPPGKVVSPACQIRVVLDVDRSVLAAGAGALAFLPNFQVFFF